MQLAFSKELDFDPILEESGPSAGSSPYRPYSIKIKLLYMIYKYLFNCFSWITSDYVVYQTIKCDGKRKCM